MADPNEPTGPDDRPTDDAALDELLDEDRPLSPEELAALAAEDDGSDDIASALSELEAADEEKPTPSFTARVMKDVETRERTWWQRVGDTVWRPRIVRFKVATLAPLLVVAAAVVAVIYLRGDDAPTARPEPPTAAPTPATPPVVDPAPDEAIAQFSLAAPDAHSVAVAGDFNGWDIAAMPLADPDGDGVWTLSVPLPRGRYAYMFVVDGSEWVIDPDAKATQPDSFGGDNALLRL